MSFSPSVFKRFETYPVIPPKSFTTRQHHAICINAQFKIKLPSVSFFVYNEYPFLPLHACRKGRPVTTYGCGASLYALIREKWVCTRWIRLVFATVRSPQYRSLDLAYLITELLFWLRVSDFNCIDVTNNFMRRVRTAVGREVWYEAARKRQEGPHLGYFTKLPLHIVSLALRGGMGPLLRSTTTL